MKYYFYTTVVVLLVTFSSLLLGGSFAQGDITSIIDQGFFEEMLKHRNDGVCEAKGFYTYDAFVEAARSFNGFGTTGGPIHRRREIAAFFGQTSHETTGGSENAPDGPYAWGYCFLRERTRADYCDRSPEWQCAPGKQYYGRGPIQITHNYNYGQAGRAPQIQRDLINNPDDVATDATLAFKTAIWFWMTPQSDKPSSHDVITGRWTPSEADRNAGRLPGYGAITNIINGGQECGRGTPNLAVRDRVRFYKRYCDMFRVPYGDNLGCMNQKPFGS